MGQAAPNERVVAVIDDDQSVRGAIRSLLRSLGFRVEAFASAEDFLDARPAGIGCLILDVRLSGMSGLDLQQRLAVTGDAPPIVFINGHPDQAARHQTPPPGPIPFLPKPVSRAAPTDSVPPAL